MTVHFNSFLMVSVKTYHKPNHGKCSLTVWIQKRTCSQLVIHNARILSALRRCSLDESPDQTLMAHGYLAHFTERMCNYPLPSNAHNARTATSLCASVITSTETYYIGTTDTERRLQEN